MKKQFRWVVFSVGCILALCTYSAWRELERLYGWGFPSAFLRGALIFLGVSILWHWARSKDERPAEKSTINVASPAPTTRCGEEYAMAPLPNGNTRERVQATNYSSEIYGDPHVINYAAPTVAAKDSGASTLQYVEVTKNKEHADDVTSALLRDSSVVPGSGTDRIGCQPYASIGLLNTGDASRADSHLVDEDAIYTRIAHELETGSEDRGLWTRLFADSDGDEKKTKVSYIKYRAAQLIAAEHSAPHNTPPEPQPTQQQSYQAPSQPSAGSGEGKWLLGIVAFIGVLWLIGEAPKNPPSPAPVPVATSDWQSRADLLERKLASGELQEIQSAFLTGFRPLYGTALPAAVAHALEAKQTWWALRRKDTMTVFIHINNTTPYTLGGFGIEFSKDNCVEGAPSLIKGHLLPSNNLAPGQQAVFSFRLDEITDGCLRIVSAWTMN